MHSWPFLTSIGSWACHMTINGSFHASPALVLPVSINSDQGGAFACLSVNYCPVTVNWGLKRKGATYLCWVHIPCREFETLVSKNGHLNLVYLPSLLYDELFAGFWRDISPLSLLFRWLLLPYYLKRPSLVTTSPLAVLMHQFASPQLAGWLYSVPHNTHFQSAVLNLWSTEKYLVHFESLGLVYKAVGRNGRAKFHNFEWLNISAK